MSVTLGFAVLALSISVVLAVGTYVTARHYLLDQRQKTVARQAFADASYLRDRLRTSGAQVSDVLGSLSPVVGSTVVLRRDGQWYSSALAVTSGAVPPRLRELVVDGEAAMVWSRLDGAPVLVVGVSLPAVGAEFYEFAPTVELASTLNTLAATLAGFAVLTTVGGAVLGRASASRVMAPLEGVASAAARIAVGEMGTRLPPTKDPDLTVIVASFNTMVEALDERIRHDARFATDVSHELRSPVTTMMTSVGLLAGSTTLPPRERKVIALVQLELGRLHRSLEDLLELGRLDASVDTHQRDLLDLGDLVRHTLAESGRSLEVFHGAGRPVLVSGDKHQLRRLLTNLLDNADLHGLGLRTVQVGVSAGFAVVQVEDAGPGVPEVDRERIFERFARSGSRGSRPGTGLGLSLATETAQAHGGGIRYQPRRQGQGACFTVRLPLAARGAAAADNACSETGELGSTSGTTERGTPGGTVEQGDGFIDELGDTRDRGPVR